ncbi:ARM repeat-containing protein [Backusella circina FSU 941]|nr:ARM repeat-containing protein [Backusella circina FSU 941]
MTTSKYEESIKELSSNDEAKKIKALRFIKNSVIGNKTKKELYIQLGVAERLVEYISSPDVSFEIKMQAVTILGSIAYGKEENVAAVVSAGAIVPLLDTLELPPAQAMEAIKEKRKLLEAVTRALKAIFASSRVSKHDIFTKNHIRDLVLLLDTTAQCLDTNVTSESLSFAKITEFSASIIARCCDTNEQQLLLEEMGAIPPLIRLLHSGCIKAQEAALDAIATLCRENRHLGQVVIQSNMGKGER